MARRGELFERAVLEFYKGLVPEAQLLFDHKVPDRQGGKERQVDVWVPGILAGENGRMKTGPICYHPASVSRTPSPRLTKPRTMA